MQKKHLTTLSAILFILFSLYSVLSKANTTGSEIEFELVDMDGNILRSEDLKGNVIVFNFWFTTCPPCKREIPELNKLVRKYNDENIVFIGVSLSNDEDIEKFISKNPFEYKIIPNASEFIEELGINSFPTQIILDREGKMTKKIHGEVNFSTMEKIIDSI